jgi:hypothetical protein
LLSKLNRKLTFAAVAVVAVVLAGGAYAATQSSSSSSRQAFLNDVAKRLGVAPAKLTSALQAAYADRLAAAVAAGRLTQAQANAIEQQIKRSGATPTPGGLPPGGGQPAWGAGGSFRGALRSGHRAGSLFGGHLVPVPGLGPGFGLFGAIGGGLKAAAGYLGSSSSKLLTEIRSGKSLAQIASAQGKTAGGLQSAIVGAIKTRLEKAVASKRITSAQAQKLLSRLASQLSAAIQQTPPKLGAMRFGWRRSSRLPGVSVPPPAIY